ncbi:MAG: hypothetical protein RQ745_04865 [Longimicrobiales bacterium]|nr:hypothetical protein [Longimicrobiales bacterium]
MNPMITRAIHPARRHLFVPVFVLMAGCAESSVPAPDAVAESSASSAREAEVIAVVEDFLEAISARDGATMEALSLPGGSVHSVALGDDGSLEGVNSRALAEDAARIPEASDPLLERMWDPVAMVHGRLAMVWTPYDFWVDGEWSHCGVDAFTLVETDAGWRVSSISYTTETSDCPESPLPPPSEGEPGVTG